ncbi:hypothetical protein HMPREF9517_00412 [Enterococcus faecalis TX1341]|uniref:Uncharacterized protein n=3 Tax=Enterococcus faecalis TaxID=1351 RepID=A0A125W1B2_ENTFL|nr:hypothetical protein HMPREF9505_02551 [Enterococcus faecalis TX0109]EFM74574.1 hypothetical protein HMPREF9515_00326 [Enterococcus faecalis TX0860]EFM77439.1 hypothetical protein HMPREF9521_00497 [Enterococcus faecalis TX2134]EFM79158.1 hypothetical protein HMPREF9514_01915 [Enterococcus faecalis TX0855]EFM81091.1 hypothetical protein HMPREF9498_03030 [Enterococcus faecalis TX4248]EFT45977.1 hypothetical protein HMPREF9500_00402 [Enterococcus faecalis TX0017]EFT48985.1 hypothetical protein
MTHIYYNGYQPFVNASSSKRKTFLVLVIRRCSVFLFMIK